MEQNKYNEDEQYIRIGKVMEISGLGRTSVYVLAKSMGFPTPYQITPRLSVWKKSEVMAWMEEQIEKSKDSKHNLTVREKEALKNKKIAS